MKANQWFQRVGDRWAISKAYNGEKFTFTLWDYNTPILYGTYPECVAKYREIVREETKRSSRGLVGSAV